MLQRRRERFLKRKRGRRGAGRDEAGSEYRQDFYNVSPLAYGLSYPFRPRPL